MRHLLIAAPLVLASLSASAIAAHVHGQAELDIAIHENIVEIELRSPQLNLAGFEHSPRKAPDQAVAVTVRRQLERPGPLLGFDHCKLTSMDLDGTLLNVDVHAAATVDDDEHPDVTAIYQFECPSAPASLDLSKLFQQFSGIEKVQVELMSSKGDASGTLTSKASQLGL